MAITDALLMMLAVAGVAEMPRLAPPPADATKSFAPPVARTAEPLREGMVTSKVCYARRITQKDQPAFDFMVILPGDRQALVADAGYTQVACPGDTHKLGAFRSRMCELAALDDAIRNRTIEVLGVDPRKMCAAARELKDDSAGQ